MSRDFLSDYPDKNAKSKSGVGASISVLRLGIPFFNEQQQHLANTVQTMHLSV